MSLKAAIALVRTSLGGVAGLPGIGQTLNPDELAGSTGFFFPVTVRGQRNSEFLNPVAATTAKASLFGQLNLTKDMLPGVDPPIEELANVLDTIVAKVEADTAANVFQPTTAEVVNFAIGILEGTPFGFIGFEVEVGSWQ